MNNLKIRHITRVFRALKKIKKSSFTCTDDIFHLADEIEPFFFKYYSIFSKNIIFNLAFTKNCLAENENIKLKYLSQLLVNLSKDYSTKSPHWLSNNLERRKQQDLILKDHLIAPEIRLAICNYRVLPVLIFILEYVKLEEEKFQLLSQAINNSINSIISLVLGIYEYNEEEAIEFPKNIYPRLPNTINIKAVEDRWLNVKNYL